MYLRFGPATRVIDSTDVWPGGNMYSRGSRSPFLARYQNGSWISSRAWASVSETWMSAGQPTCEGGTSHPSFVEAYSRRMSKCSFMVSNGENGMAMKG